MIHSSGFGFFLNRMHFNSSVRFLRSGEPLSRGQIIWRALSIHRGRGFRTSHPHSSRSSRSFILVHQLHPFIGVHSSPFISFIRSSVFIHSHSSGSSVHRCSFILRSSGSSAFIRFISIHQVYPLIRFIPIHQVHPFIGVHSSRSSRSFILVHQLHPFIGVHSSPFISFIRSSMFIHPRSSCSSDSSPFIPFITFIHPRSSGSSVHRCSFIRIHQAHQIHPHSSGSSVHHAHLNSSHSSRSSQFILIHPHSSSFITFVHPRSSAFIGVHNLRIISDIAQKFLCSFPRVYLDLQCPKAKNRALTT